MIKEMFLMVQNVSNQQLLKLLFDMKQEMSSYKKETNKKISNLENTISIQQKQLEEKDNEIKGLKETREYCTKYTIPKYA